MNSELNVIQEKENNIISEMYVNERTHYRQYV